MSVCNGCGGVIGQDCYNPRECESITRQMAMDSVPLGDENAIRDEQFKVACARAEAWKELALGTQKAFGALATLLGNASAYLETFTIAHRQGRLVSFTCYSEAVELDKDIQAVIGKVNVPIPAIIKGEVS